MIEAFYIFLGSILTFASTFLVEYWKNKQEYQKKSQNFSLYLRQELNSIKKGLEELKTIQDYRKYYDAIILGRLNISLNRLESERKTSIYLPSLELQEIYIDLISDISIFLSQVGGIQALYNSQLKDMDPTLFKSQVELTKYYEEKKVEKAIELVDIKRRLEDFIRQIYNK